MGEADGVASYSAVKVPVWLAKAAFCQGPLAVVVTHWLTGLTVRLTVAVCVVLPLVPVMVRVEVLAAAELGALTVSVAEPGAFTELELNEAVTPDGAPLTLSATAPLKPFTTPTLTVEVPLLPAFTVSEVGLAETVKSGGCTGLICRVTFAECVRLPLVPVMVSVYVPATAELLVDTLRVDEPEPLTAVGFSEAVTPVGTPLTLSATLPLNPLSAPTVAV